MLRKAAQNAAHLVPSARQAILTEILFAAITPRAMLRAGRRRVR
jgi:hypothetical protein